MSFIASERARSALRELPPLVEKIRSRDNDLAAQILFAAQSAALNLEEGSWKSGRDRSNRYRIAAGSASEARIGLRIAAALRYVGELEIAKAVGYLNEVLAILGKILGFERQGEGVAVRSRRRRSEEV